MSENSDIQIPEKTLNKMMLLELMQLKLYRQASNNLIKFTQCTFPKFDLTWFHEVYYKALDDFAQGKIKKLMVFMPPQHGKSQGSTRHLPAFMLGQNPDRRLAVLCYNSTKASKFNREIQRIILSQEYKAIFEDTSLSSGSDGYAKTNAEFEIVNHVGGLKSVGVGGALTGDPVDILIMDDLYKDAKEAWSPTVRENIEEWYDTVAETRLHNDSQQLLVFTRWHENDLAGRLLSLEKDWHVIKFEAVKTTEPNEIDPRQIGEALYPAKHNLAKLQKIKDRNPYVFQSLYQGDPQPKEGYMYGEFRTYELLPIVDSKDIKRKSYTDTADTGKDYLCSIYYVETTTAMYVVDVIYTDAAMETTEPLTAKAMVSNSIDIGWIESNNGGRGFARKVEELIRQMNNLSTKIEWFHQGENKHVRIFTNSAKVTNMIYMPKGWNFTWPLFYNHITGYLKMGNNAHDDAPDTLTGMVEFFGKEAGMQSWENFN